jgi:hypothetical protein
MMAYWSNPKDSKITSRILTLGNGVNTYNNMYAINQSEAVDSRNVSSKNYPALSVRQGSSLSFGTDVAVITTPNGATARGGATFHVVDGTTWKYWNGSAFVNVATGLTNATAKFVEFATATTKYTIMCNGTEKKSYDGTTVADLTEAPATKLICVDDNRLYALKDKKIYYSSFGDLTDFTTVNDSGVRTIVGMIGDETAIAAYQDIVIAFSDKTMHLLYGDDYENFQLMDPIQAGCISDRSIVEHDSKLYFMDYGQYKLFTGGFPVDVSQKVKKYLEAINYTHKAKIVAGTQGRYIYLSIPYGASATTNNITLEYDTETRNWYIIDKGYLNFVNIGEFLYGVRTNGVVDKMNTGTADGSTAIVWYHNTGILNAIPVKPNTTLANIYMECLVPAGSTLTVKYCETTDDADFTTIKSITASADEQKARVQIPTSVLANSERYRLQFSGTGPCTIYFVELHESTQRW